MLAGPSLASLAVTMRFGRKQVGNATGFVASAGDTFYLVTNWHVVTGRNPQTGQPLNTNGAVPDQLAVLHHVKGKPGAWKHRLHRLYDDHDEPLWLEHPTHGRDVDVVALPIDQPRGARFCSYAIPFHGDPIAFGPSSQVSIIGFPFAISGGGGLGVWVQGTIASEPALDYWDLPLLLVDSRTRSGQSGSPVILYRTEGYWTEGRSLINNGVPAIRLIGVYSGRINDQSDLGLVWKLDALREIIDAGKRGPYPTIA
jgi:hypothetical protein